MLEDVRCDEADGALGAGELCVFLVLALGRADEHAAEVELAQEACRRVLTRLTLVVFPVGTDLEAVRNVCQQTHIVHVGLAAVDLSQFLVGDEARVFRRARLGLDRLSRSGLQLGELLGPLVGRVLRDDELATLVNVAQNNLKLVHIDDRTEREGSTRLVGVDP